jgi:hypothetical protein
MSSKERQRPPQYGLRLSPARREAWDKAAHRNGLTLSVLIMVTVDRRARYDGGLEQFAGPRVADEPPTAEEVEELSAFPAPAPEPELYRHPVELRRFLGWATRCECGEFV